MINYIDGEAAKKHLVSITAYNSENDIKKEVFKAVKWNEWLGGIWDAICALDNIPAADVHPVVYCKNCNLWFEDDKVGYENLRNVSAPCLYFSNLENSYTVYTKPDDYCSYGEEVGEK